MIKKYFAMSIIAASVSLAACSDDDDDTDPLVAMEPGGDNGEEEPAPITMEPVESTSPPANAEDDSSAYDIVANAPELSTLAAAINEAGLADFLDDPENTFTIFAPTNAAFDALDAVPTGDDLSRVLQFHVVSGTALQIGLSEGATSATEAEPFTLPSILTDAEADLTFTTDGGDGLSVVDSFGNAAIIETFDLMPQGVGATGVVHFIDTVLTPPAADEPAVTPVDGPTAPVTQGAAGASLAGSGIYTIFLDSLNGEDGVSGPFPGSLDTSEFTFFIPSDDVLTAAGLTELTIDQVQTHIIGSGPVDPAALAAATSISTSNNLTFAVDSTDGVTTVDGSTVQLIATGDAGAQVYSVDGILGVGAAAPQSDPEIELPAEDPVTPVDDTETPAEETETPAEDTETPAEDTETPAEDTETPAEDTEAPAEEA